MLYRVALAALVLLLIGCKPMPPTIWRDQGPTWQKAPVTVYVDADWLRPSCIVAMEWWNYQLGFTMFTHKGPDDAVAAIHVSDDPKVYTGEAWIDNKTGRVRVHIAPMDIQLAYYFCLHELGHAIGLQHDNQPNSVMNHRMMKGSSLMSEGEDVWLPMPVLMRDDAEALRRHYNPAQ